MRTANLLQDLPSTERGERLEVLAGGAGVRIERIVSPPRHRSPAGFWYDQRDEEWVLLVAGAAALEVEGREGLVELAVGDWAHIPAGCRHRVAWTADETPTIWLAIHYPAESDGSSESEVPSRRQ